MSASQWRRAMNSGVGRQGFARAMTVSAAREGGPAQQSVVTARILPRVQNALAQIRLHHVLVLVAVLVYPWVVNSFFAFQIGGQALALGLIALSLTFLGGSGGMVSLAQMSVAGVASYMVAIFGVAGAAQGGASSLHWPWWIAVPLAVLVATLFAVLVGWLSVRTEGIYTIMITLAIGVSFYYLAQQNYTIFGGHEGFNQVYAPEVFGIDFREPIPYYYLALGCAIAGYFFIKYLLRAPFGIALQGVRDNPRRMNALGFHVTGHRVAAYAVAGVLAAVGGVLMVWYNSRVSPGSASTEMMLNILIISVMGGLRHPIGAFMGAIVFVLVQNFAIDVIARERFNLVIGAVFLSIVLFSPDGLLGLWAYFRARAVRAGARHREMSFNSGRSPQKAGG